MNSGIPVILPLRWISGHALVGGVLLFLASFTVRAHRLDEYLQAALIGITQDEIHLRLAMTPGAAVAGAVVSLIDSNGDAQISPEEQKAYVTRVLGDVELRLDGNLVRLEASRSHFPLVEEMREGSGMIELDLLGRVPATPAGGHVLRFQNRHSTNISVYLANALAPGTAEVTVDRQRRDYLQTELQIDYTLSPEVAAGHPKPGPETAEAPKQPSSPKPIQYLPATLVILALLLFGILVNRRRGRGENGISVNRSTALGENTTQAKFVSGRRRGAILVSLRWRVGRRK